MLLGTSEIKIALLGNVSAGKTTVLNAMFKDKYAEVSMKRTTAGVNYFRICAPSSPQTKEPAGDEKEETKNKENNFKDPETSAARSSSSEESPQAPSSDATNHRERLIQFYQKYNVDKLDSVDSILAKYKGKEELLFRRIQTKYGPEFSSAPDENGQTGTCETHENTRKEDHDEGGDSAEQKDRETPWFPHTDEPRSAKSTLEEITADNRSLRESSKVQEKWFDIELAENLVEMRRGTQLVVVDIPGINEAGACNKYKDYVIEKWDTFDCVVLVMDGRQGVNTEDQVFLLNLIEKNSRRRKEVPIIILFNKVDDPSDKEQAELVREARDEVERTFGSVHCVVDPVPESNPVSSPSKTSPPPMQTSNVANTNPGFQFQFGAPFAAPRAQSASGTAFGANTAIKASASTSPFGFGSTTVTANAPATTSPFGTAFGATTTSKASAPAPAPAFSLPQTAPPQGGGFSTGSSGPKQKRRMVRAKRPNLGSTTVTANAPASTSPFGTPLGASTTSMAPSLGKTKPSFIPISAMHAFIHQSASSMTLDRFKLFFDKDLIEKVGRFQLGNRRWNKLTEEQRTLETYDILSDPSIHIESLKDSNFDKFLLVLSQAIGGEKVQCKLLEGQIRRSLRTLKDKKDYKQTSLVWERIELAASIESVAAKTQALLGGDAIKRMVPDLVDSFWGSYRSLEDAALAYLQKAGPYDMTVLAVPMEELISCHKLCAKLDLGNLRQRVEVQMKVLFRRQLDLLLSHSTNGAWFLSPIDWHHIWGSILLVASISKRFCLEFGKEKVLILDVQYAMAQRKWLQCVDSYPHAPNGKFKNEVVCPSCGAACTAHQKYNDNPPLRECSRCQKLFYEGPSIKLCTAKCRSCSSAIENGKCSGGRRSGGHCSYSYHSVSDPKPYRHALKYTFNAGCGELLPTCCGYQAVTRLQIPSSPSNPHHYGHIAFRYCEYMDAGRKSANQG